MRVGSTTCPERTAVSWLWGLALVAAGAAPVDGAARKTTLDVRLDPPSGAIEVVARLDGVGDTEASVLELLSALEIESVQLLDQRGRRTPVRLQALPSPPPEAPAQGSGAQLKGLDVRRYRVEPPPRAAATGGREASVLELSYRGTLRQDWRAGEVRGEIHNFRVAAHVGEEGVYLSGEAPWYPRWVVAPDASGPSAGGSALWNEFEVHLRGVPGMLLVASGDRADAGSARVAGADTHWRTPFAQSELTVAGGPLRAFSRRAGEVTLWALVGDANAGFAARLLEAAAGYLDLYQPLIGRYPFRELVIVENFFSSGFAYPGFTLLSSQVLQMGEGALRPGYLDHELLHAWWGNGVLARPGEGVWSEALTSYCANLMRAELEGRPQEARAQRRAILEGLSRLAPENDQPLATFGLENGASRFVGYQKGSLVFAQLARELGQETVWRALRALASERMGAATGWDNIQDAFERAGGRDLDAFFGFFVHGRGLPDLSPLSVEWSAASGTLALRLPAPSPVEVARLPLRFHHADAVADVEVAVPAGATEVVVVLRARPETLEIDPGYETMRRIPEGLWMPAISALRPPRPLHVLRSAAESVEAKGRYDVAARDVRARWADGEGRDAEGVVESWVAPAATAPAEPAAAAPGPGHVLVLGAAVASPWVKERLAAIELRIEPEASRFSLEGKVYDDAGAAVLACVRRTDGPGTLVCAYWGNSPAALARSHLLTFYGGDSLLVFADGRPVERRRFELTERIEL